MNRPIATTNQQHNESQEIWLRRLLNKEQCVPHGHRFFWNGVGNTAYLYEITMQHVQKGQLLLKQCSTLLGKQAYTTALKSATQFGIVLNNILPQWTFRPYLIPDATEQDIYGHYCLARATAYDAIGTADLKCSPNAMIAAASNASHLYAVAAHLIHGDVSNLVNCANYCVGKALVLRSDQYMEKWKDDSNPNGACLALACLMEADKRFNACKKGNCQDKLQFAYDRNSVHWMDPTLPPWSELIRVDISPLQYFAAT